MVLRWLSGLSLHWVITSTRPGFFVLGLAVLIPAMVEAGQVATAHGIIAGRVVDATGQPLPGVHITARSASTVVADVTSDAAGTYRFDTLPAGPVDLRFSLIHFAAHHRRVELTPGAAARVEVTLEIELIADVIVTGHRTFRDLASIDAKEGDLFGIAPAASAGVTTPAEIRERPVWRAADVLETVPGVVISQHSGTGKANQYYLRGFNLDHGTDFLTTLGDVPVNMPTHAHGHGYADANFVIPELVSGIQYTKGPYSTSEGDFSAAGSANINYVNALDRPIVRASGGSDTWARALAAASPRVGDGRLLVAGEFCYNDGPWVAPEDYRSVNGVVRYSRGERQRAVSLTFLGYDARWNATDQIPSRAVESGLISRFGTLDDSDGGETRRLSLSADGQFGGPAATTRLNGYAVGYRLNLFSNYTYALDHPDNGDQFEQADRRGVFGGRVTHRRLGTVAGRPIEYLAGAQVRHDHIGTVGLYRTSRRLRLGTVREDQVDQTSVGLFGQAEVDWVPYVRTTLGLRGDVYRFDVEASLPENSGTAAAGLASPKAGVVFGPWKRTEIYGNWGLGFHSNDARGATIALDPATGEPADRVTPLVRARGEEVGVRTTPVRGWTSTAALWRLDLDSELLFVGDAGTTEASRPSRRWGIEWTNDLRPMSWLALDADVAWSDARFTDGDPVVDGIPGAVGLVLAAGATVVRQRGLAGGLRLRYVGPRPLIEDGSVESTASTLLNGQLRYGFGRGIAIVIDAFNLANATASDIDYFYTSRLPGEPDAGVDDIHTHPAPPRAFRISLTTGW